MARTRYPRLYDPACKRLAADMPELDRHWIEDKQEYAEMEEDEKQRMRADYVFFRKDSLDPKTGYFSCDLHEAP